MIIHQGLKNLVTFCIFKVAIEIPYIFVQAMVYGIIVYAMIGFEWTAAKFFWYIFFMYFTLLYYTFYGMMAVGLTPNYQVASIVSASFYSLWNLFSGFVIPRPVSIIPTYYFVIYLNMLNGKSCYYLFFIFLC